VDVRKGIRVEGTGVELDPGDVHADKRKMMKAESKALRMRRL
jgi:hypothetical protein